MENKVELECQSVTTALKNFKVVVHKCFGQEVVDGYENAISKFSKDLRKIGRDPTLKVHILEVHIVQFLKRKYIAYPGKGLGFFAEQASESVIMIGTICGLVTSIKDLWSTKTMIVEKMWCDL